MNFSQYFSRQARKPSGWFGKWIMSPLFDRGNAFLNNFMIDILDVQKNDHILEIGFGTGKVLYELAKNINNGIFEGIDFSPPMIEVAERKNKKFIEQGRIILHQGDFMDYSFAKNNFDKILSCNTVYFWAEPEDYLKKIRRILKPGGKAVIAFEDKGHLTNRSLDADTFRLYGKDEILSLFKVDGLFKEIRVLTRKKGTQQYQCAVAVK